MLKRYVLGICVGIMSFAMNASANSHFYSESSPFAETPTPFDASTATPQAPVMNPFTQLIIDGNVDVDIKTGKSPSSILITGTGGNDLLHAHVQESHDTLRLKVDSGYPREGVMHVVVSTQYLNNLVVKNNKGRINVIGLDSSYFNADIESDTSLILNGTIGLHHLVTKGNASVHIQGINSPSLKVWMQDNSTVDLAGVANLKLLKTSGSGKLRMYWVNSDYLTIRQSDNSQVELAGVAKIVDVELTDNAYFNGRYLRVGKGYAKTMNNSRADVQFLKAQSTLANDNSVINTFGKPAYENDLMGRSGAVLDMARSQ